MKKKLLVVALCWFIFGPAFTQSKSGWHGKKCVVSLTYDDALNVHLDQVAPALDSLGLKGTFFVSGYSGAFTKRVGEWRALAAKGHELGNHTLYHPCAGKPAGRGFVVPEYDLDLYSVKRMADEMKMTNALLQALDGKSKRTFAYPCGDTLASGKPYYGAAKEDFIAARGVHPEYVPVNGLHAANVGSFMVNGQTGEQLIALVKKAMKSQTGIVFLFHGVGGEHSLNVSLTAHRQLIKYLKQHEKEIWVATFLDMAEFALNNKTLPAVRSETKTKKK